MARSAEYLRFNAPKRLIILPCLLTDRGTHLARGDCMNELQWFHEHFEYSPETGSLKWKVRLGRAKQWSEVGSKNASGYINLVINGRQFYAHRVIFAMMTGRWPKEIDHVDGDKSNNRWCNLRECTRSQNNWNRDTYAQNTSGVVGVSPRTKYGDWQVAIRVSNSRIFLGYFKSFEEAVIARKNAELKYWGEFRRR